MLFLCTLYKQLQIITNIINGEEKQAIPTNRKLKNSNTSREKTYFNTWNLRSAHVQTPRSHLPSLNSRSSSSLVQLHEVIRKKPLASNTLEREFTYCFLLSTALSGLRLMASNVPLSIQIWNPDSFVERFKKSSTCIKNQQLMHKLYRFPMTAWKKLQIKGSINYSSISIE